MRYTLRREHEGWAIAITSAGCPKSLGTCAWAALWTLTVTEGLAPGFYEYDEDYVDAVIATLETTELWKRYGDEPMELTIPYSGATLTVDVTDPRN